MSEAAYPFPPKRAPKARGACARFARARRRSPGLEQPQAALIPIASIFPPCWTATERPGVELVRVQPIPSRSS